MACWAEEHDVRLSVGRTGSCRNNAIAESFFGAPKNEMYSLRKWADRDAVIDYIERRYNRNRPRSTIDYKIPTEVMETFFARTKPVKKKAVMQPTCEEKMAA